jgi:hypothetical protein
MERDHQQKNRGLYLQFPQVLVFLAFVAGCIELLVKRCIHRARKPKTYIGRHWKQCQIPNWTPPLLLRTGASYDQWMVSPCCDEWMTTWCGLTHARVLQVQVVAWFALVQVKSGRESSLPCGASIGGLLVLATTLVKRPWPSKCTSFSNKVWLSIN